MGILGNVYSMPAAWPLTFGEGDSENDAEAADGKHVVKAGGGNHQGRDALVGAVALFTQRQHAGHYDRRRDRRQHEPGDTTPPTSTSPLPCLLYMPHDHSHTVFDLISEHTLISGHPSFFF